MYSMQGLETLNGHISYDSCFGLCQFSHLVRIKCFSLRLFVGRVICCLLKMTGMIVKMGRLFRKIFFGFWLTLLITGAAVGTLVWKHNQQRIEQLEVLVDNSRADMSRQQPQKGNELMQRIEKESQRLNELVGELLTLSRLEADVGNHENDYFDINGLVESIANDARFEANSQNKQIIFKPCKEVLLNDSMNCCAEPLKKLSVMLFITPRK